MTARPKYMLDTNMYIYINHRKAASVLARFEALPAGQAVISVITWGELFFGARKSYNSAAACNALEEISALIPVLSMPPECAKYYGKIRADLEKRGLPIGHQDLWIAAHAMVSGLTLVTNNTKEFERIPHLKIENWV